MDFGALSIFGDRTVVRACDRVELIADEFGEIDATFRGDLAEGVERRPSHARADALRSPGRINGRPTWLAAPAPILNLTGIDRHARRGAAVGTHGVPAIGVEHGLIR